jgi:hypothetical protein
MRIRTITTSTAAALTALLLAACGSDEPEAAAASAPAGEETASYPEPDEAEDVPAEEAAEEDVPVEEVLEASGPTPFDPDAEIDPRDIEVREWGADEAERPWELMMVPDGLVLPASASLSTWYAIEEPFRNEQHGGLSTSGALRVKDADPDDVHGFFSDRLGAAGWELDRDDRQGDAWNQVWTTRIPWDDWKHDEFAVEVRVEVSFIPSRSTPGEGTLQFHDRATAERHDRG